MWFWSKKLNKNLSITLLKKKRFKISLQTNFKSILNFDYKIIFYVKNSIFSAFFDLIMYEIYKVILNKI